MHALTLSHLIHFTSHSHISCHSLHFTFSHVIFLYINRPVSPANRIDHKTSHVISLSCLSLTLSLSLLPSSLISVTYSLISLSLTLTHTGQSHQPIGSIIKPGETSKHVMCVCICVCECMNECVSE